MVYKSRFFKKEEFYCKCGKCAKAEPDSILVDRLDILRKAVGQPLIVASGIRCEAHNAAVGGAVPSAHVARMAVDIACPDSRLRHKLLVQVPVLFKRFGIGKDFVHVDVAPEPFPQEVCWTYY